MHELLAGALCALLLNAWALGLRRPPLPEPSSMRLDPSDAAETAAFLTLGMRRLGADIAFVRLLMYYGTPEPGAEEHEEAAGHYHHEGGSYAELGPRTLRIMDLDPYFAYAPLFGAGALAFNLNRPDEALAVLEAAADRDPKQWKYRAAMAGIGFHKKGDPLKVIRELSPMLAEPDCPTLLKNLLAFLNRRAGRREEAARIYRDILTSRDPAYYAMARQALQELGSPAE